MSQQSPKPHKCRECGSFDCGPYRCRFKEPSNPWHAECAHCGAWLVPPRSTICARCEEKVNAYADAAIRRDLLRGPVGYIEYTPHGEILGPNDREHRHDSNYVDRSDE